MALCDRLRLMYFGNLWQDWSEFVPADLGIYRYESVEFSADSRGFRLRADVDAYLHLFDCRQRFDLGEPLEELLAGLPGEPYANPWLEGRRVKLLFQFAQHCESSGISTWPSGSIANPATPARACGRFAAWNAASASPKPMHWRGRPAVRRKATPNARAWPDCCRACKGRLGLPRQARAAAPEIDRLDLCLAYPSEPCSVEWAVREHLEEPDCAVHYVENGLDQFAVRTALLGGDLRRHSRSVLPSLPQRAADLHSADFRQRRAALFEACLGRLEDGSYRDAIRCRYRDKFGPAVALRLLGTAWRGTARTGARLPTGGPPARLVRTPAGGYPGNRAGLPDLIQFWPAQRRYRMVEVKGPGDRLQDNQLRWLQILPRAGDAGGGLPRALAFR